MSERYSILPKEPSIGGGYVRGQGNLLKADMGSYRRKKTAEASMSNNFMGVQNGDPKESWATPTLDRYFGNPTPQTLPLDAPVKVSALNQTNVRRVVVSGARIAYQTPPSTALCDTQSESSNESSPGSQKGTYVAGLSDALDKMVTGPSPDSERY